MMKFFRKYTKHLLAVFMALLLIVWLGADAMQSLLQPDRHNTSEKIGWALGKVVRLGDLQVASNRSHLLGRMEKPWQAPWFMMAAMIAGSRDVREARFLAQQIRSEPLTEEEWMLLDLAAAGSGAEVSEESLERQRGEIPPAYLDRLREATGASLRQIDDALRSFIRVQDAAFQAVRAVKATDADVQDFLRQTGEKLRVAMAVIPADTLIDPAFEPAAEAIAAHFEEHKNHLPDPGAGRPFGYQQPEAAQVEFIRVSVGPLVAGQSIDEDTAYEYWKAHQSEFLRPATQPATTTAPGEPPAPEPPRPYETFSECRGKVYDRLKLQAAKAQAAEIAEELIRNLQLAWKGSPVTRPEGGYKAIPEAVLAADYYERQANSSRHPGVLSYGRTMPGDARALAAQPQIGRASIMEGSTPLVPFSRAAFMVPESSLKPTDDPQTARFFRNLYETCPSPVVDHEGNAYVFRTVALHPAHAPASVDEVRPQVIADLRRVRAREQARARAGQLAERAKAVGLKAAVDEDAELKGKLGQRGFQEPEPFARKRMFAWGGRAQLFPGGPPEMAGDAGFVDLCFSLAGQQDRAARVAVYEQPMRNRWVVVEVLEQVPLTSEEYEQQRPGAFAAVSMERRLDLLREWFSAEQIRRRADWKPVEQPDHAASPESESPKDRAGASG